MYNLDFNEYENNTFNLIEHETVRKNTMALYRVLVLNLNGDTLNLSFRKILGKFNTRKRKEKKKDISIGTLKNRIEKLTELGLIEIIKIGKQKYAYKIERKDTAENELNGKLNGKLNGLDDLEDIEITTSTTKNDCSKSIINNNIYNIYLTVPEKEALIKDTIKFFEIKDKLTIKSINLKLKDKNLNAAGALRYIEKVILETTLFFKTLGILVNSKARKVFNKKQKGKLKFQQHDQRSYDYKKEESELFGWDD